MSKQRLLKILLGFLLVIYSIVGYFYYIQYSDISLNYREYETSRVKRIEEGIASSLTSDDPQGNLQKLVEDYAVEVIIRTDEGVFFETLELEEDANLNQLLNSKVVLSEVWGKLEIDGITYEIYYSAYHLPATVYFNDFLISGNRYLVLLVLLFLSIIILIQWSLYRPLVEVKTAVQSLEEYHFDKIPEGKDSINRDLSLFANKLERNMNLVTRKYSGLELELEQQRLRLENMMVLARAMIHDLKTPLHRAMLENEIKLKNASPEEREVFQYNLDSLTNTMQEVNKLLKILGGIHSDLPQKNEMIEIDQVVSEVIKIFEPYIREKKLTLEIELPHELKIESNLVIMRLLLHNILSNMLQYATDETEIELFVHNDDEKVTLISRNKSSAENIERMKNSEKLFNSMKTEESHPLSSGNGLYLIKDLTAMLGGEYRVHVEENVVEVAIELRVNSYEG